jgi:hypothetical protein
MLSKESRRGTGATPSDPERGLSEVRRTESKAESRGSRGVVEGTAGLLKPEEVEEPVSRILLSCSLPPTKVRGNK